MEVEIIGMIASVLILISMTIQSATDKGNLIMRTINIVGSTVFVVYGFLIPAYSTAFMNIAIVIVDVIYIASILCRMRKINKERN